MHSDHSPNREPRGMARRAPRWAAVRWAALAMVLNTALHAQATRDSSHDSSAASLDSLIARAITVSARLRAAGARVEAARARITPAGLRPDPMLMVGVQNMPLTSPGFSDDMTMKMVGASQTIPLWGKLGLARAAAQRDAEVAAAQITATALEIRRDVQFAFYDLAYVDRALEIVERNRLVLIDLISAAEIRFSTGTSSPTAAMAPAAVPMSAPAGDSRSGMAAAGSMNAGRANASGSGGGSMGSMGSGIAVRPATSALPASGAGSAAGSTMSGARSAVMPEPRSGMVAQVGGGMSSGLTDILRARVDAARLAEQASALREERRTALARLNSLLDRPSDTPVIGIGIPPLVERAAVTAAATDVRFESAMLGSRASGSPLPSVDSLQRLARRASPELNSRTAVIAAQSTRVELTLRERRPDIEAAVQYGQRDGYPDMVTGIISVQLPLRRGDRQDQYVVASRAELLALEADRHDAMIRLNADVARLHAAAERSRTQLALYKAAVLPQTQLGVDAALVSFTTGGGPLRNILDAQTAVFNSEIAYHRALADFARTIAELEQVVGAEVIHD